jgi:D-lactate dehydrogenase
MRIAFFEANEWEIPYLREKLSKHETRFHPGKLQETDLTQLGDVDAVSVFIYSKMGADALSGFPRLRLIATRSTGYDHIDLAACKQRGVVVTNVPSYGENTVAEHTFALILALSRHVHKSYLRVTQGNLSREGLTGFDLKGKTLGVIGAGRIGLHVVKIARGFGMDVLVTDVRRDTFLAELLGFRYVSVEELLAGSHIISLHMPYSQETHHFLNAERLRMVRKGALLINTARGGLVDTDALLAALNDGILAGAGLDVIEGEEYIAEEQEMLRSNQPAAVLRQVVRDHLLLRHENVVFTPHNAFNSREALLRILDTTVDNILNFLGGSPQNTIGS